MSIWQLSTGKRIFGLDLLRAFAVLFVVFNHGWGVIRGTWVTEYVPAWLYRLPVLDGVSIFFVLSGFLIGRILLRTVSREGFNRSMLLEFWVRRWSRTLPNYMLVLTFLVTVKLLNGVNLDHLVRYYTFTQNLISPHPAFFPEAWSLSVEEWFYLAIPIPLYLATKIKGLNRQSVTLLWIFAVILASTAFRVYRVNHLNIPDIHTWDIELRKQVITRMDSLMYGVLAAYISIYSEKCWNRIAPLALAIGIALIILDKTLMTISPSMFYRNYFTFSVMAVGTALLLPKLSTWRKTNGVVVPIITFVSLTSYSMYLLNLSPVQGVILPRAMNYIMYVFAGLEHFRPVIAYFSYWLITIVLSYLLYRFFERPMTALRDRWPSRDSHVEAPFSPGDHQPLAPKTSHGGDGLR